jgi:O-antigen/teichoic acid export membrane protein
VWRISFDRKAETSDLQSAGISVKNLHNLSVLVIVNFTVAGIGFLTTVKIANTLGKETFGLLAYGLAVSAYGIAFIRFGQDKHLCGIH